MVITSIVIETSSALEQLKFHRQYNYEITPDYVVDLAFGNVGWWVQFFFGDCIK